MFCFRANNTRVIIAPKCSLQNINTHKNMKQLLYVDNDYNKNKYECFPMKERVK